MTDALAGGLFPLTHPVAGRCVLLGEWGGDADLVGDAADAGRLGERVAVPCGVAARDAVALCVGGLEADSDLDGVGEGVTGAHAPHASPGNPGAPGLAATATYPVLHPPRYVMPQLAYPGGQAAQGGAPPVAY